MNETAKFHTQLTQSMSYFHLLRRYQLSARPWPKQPSFIPGYPGVHTSLVDYSEDTQIYTWEPPKQSGLVPGYRRAGTRVSTLEWPGQPGLVPGYSRVYTRIFTRASAQWPGSTRVYTLLVYTLEIPRYPPEYDRNNHVRYPGICHPLQSIPFKAWRYVIFFRVRLLNLWKVAVVATVQPRTNKAARSGTQQQADVTVYDRQTNETNTLVENIVEHTGVPLIGTGLSQCHACV